MTNQQLPTIDIRGKEYVLVADRVKYFNENFPNGSIRTERLSEGNMEIVKATVIPDVSNPERYFTGYSQAKWSEIENVVGNGKKKFDVNFTAALENAETSATGRALGFLGIGIISSICSADEIFKAEQASQNLGNNRFERALNNTEYMHKFNSEDEYIESIKKAVKTQMTEQQEQDLRLSYQCEIEHLKQGDELPY